MRKDMRTEELICIAERGDATAAFALGILSERLGNVSDAERYYRISAESSPLGAAALASLLATSDREKFSSGSRRQEAIRFAEFAAKHNISTGHLILGMLSLYTDEKAAFEHFEAARNLGSDLALAYIGQLRADVASSKFDIAEAERILDAINKNNKIVPHCLISIVHLVRGRHAEAIFALWRGVSAGDAESMFTLAMFHRLGMFGVDKNDRLAAELQSKGIAAFHL
ncbi:MAG: hypothetical protein AB7S74_17850 [Hyphomicrobium sp.]